MALDADTDTDFIDSRNLTFGLSGAPYGRIEP